MPVGVVLTRQGNDIGPLINAHAAANAMPTRPLTAQLWAESRFDERAERWGSRTREALECIRVLREAGEWP